MSAQPSDNKDRNWPKDEFGQNEVVSQFMPWVIAAVALLSASLLPYFQCFSNRQPQVIAYCAQHRDYAEPIFRKFEHETGIRVT